MKESRYQAHLIKLLKKMFPGCLIMKMNAGYRQGIPDLLILFNNRWALLEVKASKDAEQQPNQAYYVKKANEMSFAAFIYPENEKEVLHELQQALRPARKARPAQS